jgi:prevent-host-death family protein
MKTVNVHEAKTQLSRLLAEAERGGDVVIARDGKPVARLVRYVEDKAGQGPRFGSLKALFSELPPDAFDPVPDHVWDALKGKV